MCTRARTGTLRRLAGLLVLLATAEARALTVPALGPPGQPDIAGAQAAFDRAVAALRQKRPTEVDVAAREAYALGFGADAVELVAVAALQNTHVSLAHACYVALAADAEVPAGPRGRAQRQLAALDGQGGKVALEGLPDAARITLDGVSLGAAPLSGPVLAMPGAHVLTVTVEGFPEQKRTLRFVRGKSETVLAWKAPAPVPAATPASAPAPAPATSPATPPVAASEAPAERRFGPAPTPVAPPVLPGLAAAALQPFVGRPVQLETRFGPLPVVELLRVEAETAVLGPAEDPQRLPLSALRRVEAAGGVGPSGGVQ